ncbi:hypothetical protein O163_14005 [Caldanaerobacter subterraneus subsp. yonseiensis KB-1]|uniref:Uncharacterized protein n=1 Tax=Caldanaerobacter subterraneus subsp. yonseiensis KB-1 TaxID=1388761 RepID=U5CCZ2_CALSX|nr:hypothetical protein O163_14005 [Caldanaerobacter subterraneus subsp. yonseiensis KB-1]
MPKRSKANTVVRLLFSGFIIIVSKLKIRKEKGKSINFTYIFIGIPALNTTIKNIKKMTARFVYTLKKKDINMVIREKVSFKTGCTKYILFVYA